MDKVTATASDHDTVTVTWHPPAKPNGNIVQYRITYNASDGTSSNILILGDRLKITIDNLTPNTTYYISVTAKTSKGFGGQGTTVNASTRK